MADRENLRLAITNALVLADELLDLELAAEPTPAGQLLERELEIVLKHARDFAGLNPDGSFDQVPPAPSKKARGK